MWNPTSAVRRARAWATLAICACAPGCAETVNDSEPVAADSPYLGDLAEPGQLSDQRTSAARAAADPAGGASAAAFASLNGSGSLDPRMRPPIVWTDKPLPAPPPPPAAVATLGSRWHPDPDDDGVATETDRCPDIHDPAQTDGDGDGRGDACDPDALPFDPGGAVLDLRAEHVTPYGAWLTFTSPQSSAYYWYGYLVWSTNPANIATPGAIAERMADGDGVDLRVRAGQGARIERPVILTGLQSDTTYYATLRRFDASGIRLSDTPGNVFSFTTAPAPAVADPAALSPGHPRVWARPDLVQDLRMREQTGDPDLLTWIARLSRRVMIAVATASNPLSHQQCNNAALMWHATGDVAYRDAALLLIDAMIPYWESGLGGNAYRWADAALGTCADLMWNEIAPETRDRAVAALLHVDEANLDVRLEDTDEVASTARTLVIDGLLACGASDLGDPTLSERACAVLDHGLRLVYGVQLVKARRDRGVFGQSGGSLPDGIGYGQGTFGYWLHALWALANAGAPEPAEYGPFVYGGVLALRVHPLTPRRRGYATFGDLDSYDNFAVEPNSLPLDDRGGIISLAAGLLDHADMAEQAAHARWLIGELFDDTPTALTWAALLFDRPDRPGHDYRTALATAYLDSGMGMLFDRSGWDEDASMLSFRAGWSGVDHVHADAGHFQFYRRGVWLTHEALGYDGAAATAIGHNVPLLDVRIGNQQEQAQYNVRGGASPARVIRAGSGTHHTFATADLLGQYTSHYDKSYAYDAVQRSLLWLKDPDRDQLVIYDAIDNAAGVTGVARAFQLNLSAQPQIVVDGDRAVAVADLPGDSEPQRVEIEAVLPAAALLAPLDPDGVPNHYPGEVYTHRLVAGPGAAGSQQNLRMLITVRAADISQPAGPAPAAIETASHVGVRLGADVAIFPRAALSRDDGAGAPAPIADAVVLGGPAPLPARVWWAGVKPGSEVVAAVAPAPGAPDAVEIAIRPATAGDVARIRADGSGLVAFTVDAAGQIARTYPE